MNVFELSAKLGIDTKEYDEGLNKAEGSGESFASKVGGVIGKGVKAGVAVAGAAIGAATTGIAALTTQAVNAYGDYEQLIGGVEKLFGDSANTVMNNADEAFKTAGLSANEYMETVTGVSAALINSLGGDTQAAAELADVAIRDMSDNANTFGTDMASVMGVYQGLSKGMYQTLDNLKLGYAGTKTGAEQLIADAEKMDEAFSAQRDETGALTLSYGDMVQAIHIVQENMNIAGTTTKEASSTIQGSMGMLSSAWTNLITGLGDGSQNLEPLISNVVDSALKLAGNIEPIALQAVNGVAKLIDGFAPVIANELPTIIETIAPPLGNAVVSVVSSLSSVVPTLLSTLSEVILQLLPVFMDMFPVITQSVFDLISSLASWLGEGNNLQTIISGVLDLAMQLVDQFTTFLPVILPAIIEIISAIAVEISKPENVNMLLGAILQIIGSIVVALWNSLPSIFDLIVQTTGNIAATLLGWFSDNVSAVTGFFGNIWELLTGKLAEIWQKIQDFFAPFIEFISPVLNAVKYLFETIFEAIKVVVSRVFNSIKSTFTTIWNSIYNFISPIINSIKNTISNAFNSLVNLVSTPLNNLKNTITNIFNSIKEKIVSIGTSAKTWGKDLIDNFVSGIKSKISSVTSAITGVADKIRSIIGFSEPSDGPLSNFHTYAPDMIDLFTQGLYQNENKIAEAFDEILIPPALDGTVNIGATGAYSASTTPTSAAGYGNSPITFNIYASEGQDVRELAREVSKEIQNIIADKEKAYA